MSSFINIFLKISKHHVAGITDMKGSDCEINFDYDIKSRLQLYDYFRKNRFLFPYTSSRLSITLTHMVMRGLRGRWMGLQTDNRIYRLTGQLKDR